MWAIGNGESRSKLNIDRLYGPKVGCNAIMRDYQMNHLVCVDRRMVDEAINSKVNELSIVYTRQDWIDRYKNNKHIRVVPDLPYEGNQRWDEPFQWGSGPYAVLIAAKNAKENYVNLIGFDLYSKNKLVNNVYKDTPNYDPGTKNAVDPRYWVHQIGMVIKYFPKLEFNIFQESDWSLPKEWNYSQVKVDNINKLM